MYQYLPILYHIQKFKTMKKHRFYLYLLYNIYRIFKKLDVFVKAYPYLSLIRCLVHFILDLCSMYYFRKMSMIVCGHTFF